MLLWTGGHNIHNIVCLKDRLCFVVFSFGFKLSYILHYDVASLCSCCLYLSLLFLTFSDFRDTSWKRRFQHLPKLFPQQSRTITKFTPFTLISGNLSAKLWKRKKKTEKGNRACFSVLNSWNTFPWVSLMAADKTAKNCVAGLLELVTTQQRVLRQACKFIIITKNKL